MATVVRRFEKGAQQTARGTGRLRQDYGAAMKARMKGLEAASKKYNAGVMTAREMANMQMVYVEQAMAAMAGGINSLTEGLNLIMPMTDKQIGTMKLISGSMQMTRAIIGIYRMWTTAIEAHKVKQAALASGETAVHVAAQDYAGIAFALSAVGIFGATFAGGYYVGKQSVVNGGEADLSTHAGRRHAMAVVEGAS